MIARWLSVLWLGCLMGCDPGDGPLIDRFVFTGQAPESDAVLTFALDLRDPDGDLGEGVLQTLVNTRDGPGEIMALAPLFLAADLPLSAVEASLRLAVELSVPAEALTEAFAPFRIAVRAVDASGNESPLAEVALMARSR